MSNVTYLFSLLLIALGLMVPLAGVIFSDQLKHRFPQVFAWLAGMEFPMLEDPLGYSNEWDPTMGITRRDLLVRQRDDAVQVAGIDPLSPDYPPLLDIHVTSDGKPLKFL